MASKIDLQQVLKGLHGGVGSMHVCVGSMHVCVEKLLKINLMASVPLSCNCHCHCHSTVSLTQHNVLRWCICHNAALVPWCTVNVQCTVVGNNTQLARVIGNTHSTRGTQALRRLFNERLSGSCLDKIKTTRIVHFFACCSF